MIVHQQLNPGARSVRVEILNDGLEKLNHPLTILQPEDSVITTLAGATR
jgi:hypothetical protein